MEPTRMHAPSSFAADLLERTGATGVQVALAWAAVEALDWPEAWAILIAALLAVLKGVAAKYVGNRDSASLAPSVPPRPGTLAG